MGRIFPTFFVSLLLPKACGEPSAWPYVLVLLEEMKGSFTLGKIWVDLLQMYPINVYKGKL